MQLRLRNILAKSGVAAPLALSALAGSATFNFDTDLSTDPNFVTGSNVSWTDPVTFEQIDFYEDRDLNGRGEGGNPATGGYLAITRAANSQYSQILFPDFDNGLVVRAFSFDCDLRLGNATGNDGRPADGFSINYARSDDPAVVFLQNNPGTSDSNNYAIPGAPEGGTRTGLSVCFDTWSGNTWPNGEADIEGIIVRVDNTTVVRYGMPVRNGTCEDITSLQTGPFNAATLGDYKANDLDPTYPGLCWTKLNVELNEAGELTVKFKGATLLDKSPTGFAPSAGRILLAGRTGGANQNNHIDNLTITTVPADKALLTRATATATGVSASIEDSGQSVVDPATAAITMTVDGVAVSPLTINKTDKITTIQWNSPTYLASGRSLAVGVSFKDTQGTQLDETRTAIVAAYYLLTEETWTAPGTGNANQQGFKARIWQVDQLGTVGLLNYARRAEQQLAGIIGENVIDTTGAVGGLFEFGTINWNQDFASAEIGNFQTSSTPSRPDEAVPGIPGIGNPTYNTDNIAAEIITYIEFPAVGMYTMGVNSDDGFRVTATDVPPANNLALAVTGAASAAGSYHIALAPPATGKPITAPISGKLVYMDPADGCTTPVNAAALQGAIAFVDRGTCEFTAKIKLAREAGAIAVVVVNNRTDDLGTWPEGVFPIEMAAGAAGYQDVPSVMISWPDGEKIKTAIASGNLNASLTPDSTPIVGEFEGGRGASDSTFSILVPQAGVHPFRCVWYEGGGGANLEWFSVTASGEKILINDRENANGLRSFRARTAQPQPRPTVSVARQAGNVVVTFTGTLETATAVNGPWSASTATSPLTEAASGAAKFYRAKR